MPLTLIGAGLGRTGTASTKLALERLGVGRCYHMGEVISQPARMAGWVDAAAGKPDWEAIFEGYGACVDYPAASFWRELADYYPDAKVLLNVRSAESWFESVNETILNPGWIEEASGTPPYDFLNATIYRTMDGRMADRDYMLEHFDRHVAQVRETIPAERLLVFEVKQGWEPLCAFLGVPVPEEPFPRVNSREETKAFLAALRSSRDWDGQGHSVQKMFDA
jgi:hypothetical protein